jgi:PrtD family type I secretion system ABC transporter
LAAAVVLVGLAILNEIVSRTPASEANDVNVEVLDDANAMVRNADAISAMGMRENVIRRWQQSNAASLQLHAKSVSLSRWLTASAKFIRLMLQVSVMFAAAWLIVDGQMSAGGLIACVLLMRRAVAPLEGAIGSWKSVINVRTALRRVDEHLALRHKETPALQAPRGRLKIESLRFYHPNALKPVLRKVEFKVSPGEAVAIVGTTGAGKSTLARLIVGNAKPYRGHVYWGDIDVSDWEPEELGPHIGYLPQTVALFNGSVAENIARMGAFVPNDVMDAAELAGADEMIRALPESYDTQIGVDGVRLSGGQQQRIGLARAVFGKPKLVVLDEPDAHLDRAGRKALSGAIATLKENAAMVIMITHQVRLGSEMDRIIELQRGKAEELKPVSDTSRRTKVLS